MFKYRTCVLIVTRVIFIISLTPESVRWLRVKGHIHEAEAILERLARVNKKEIPNGTSLSTLPKQTNEKKASCLDLFRPASNAISTIIQCYAW